MTIILLITLIIQLGYWLFLFNKLGKSDGYLTNSSPSSQVSIILCVKNELEQLKANLSHILKQNHPYYDIIVADDFSSDGSTDYIKGIEYEKMVVRYYKVKQNKHGKKQALKEAIRYSDSEILAFLDADCQPATQNWLGLMTNKLTNDIDIVLGYSPYTYKKSLLGRWIHYEGWLTGVQYLSYCVAGIPYMGVGRNLAYKKELWQQPDINLHEDLSSGDDDLFVNQVTSSNNTAICIDKESFVYTEGAKTIPEYLKQKRRHFSTANRYKLIHKIVLGTYSFSQMLFYILLLAVIIAGSYKIALSIYLIRMIIIIPIVNRLKLLLDASFSLLFFPILDFFQAFYYFIFSFAVLFPQKNKW